MNQHESEVAVNEILKRFDDDQNLLQGEAYQDGGLHMLFARLERAAMNQATDGEATLSRYAIWSNTVRDHIAEAIKLLDEPETRAEAVRLLSNAHNSLAAFSEIQALFDPMRSR